MHVAEWKMKDLRNVLLAIVGFVLMPYIIDLVVDRLVSRADTKLGGLIVVVKILGELCVLQTIAISSLQHDVAQLRAKINTLVDKNKKAEHKSRDG